MGFSFRKVCYSGGWPGEWIPPAGKISGDFASAIRKRHDGIGPFLGVLDRQVLGFMCADQHRIRGLSAGDGGFEPLRLAAATRPGVGGVCRVGKFRRCRLAGFLVNAMSKRSVIVKPCSWAISSTAFRATAFFRSSKLSMARATRFCSFFNCDRSMSFRFIMCFLVLLLQLLPFSDRTDTITYFDYIVKHLLWSVEVFHVVTAPPGAILAIHPIAD